MDPTVLRPRAYWIVSNGRVGEMPMRRESTPFSNWSSSPGMWRTVSGGPSVTWWPRSGGSRADSSSSVGFAPSYIAQRSSRAYILKYGFPKLYHAGSAQGSPVRKKSSHICKVSSLACEKKEGPPLPRALKPKKIFFKCVI